MSGKKYSLLLVLFLLLSSSSFGQRGKKWNVLLITIDTLRADALGVYGNEKAETPHMDALAAQGTVFEHALAPVPLTLPSHASILTGVYPLHHGIRDNSGFLLAEDQLSLAEILSEQGYATGAFVGSFVLDSRFGLDQGFETYYSNFDLTGMDVIAPGLIQRTAGEVEKEALAWIGSQRESERPFFCWVHFYDPHAPYSPPEPFASRFRNDLYAGEVAYSDSVVGHLFETLKEWGLFEETIIVVTGDHGEALGEHNEETHGFFIYEETMQVPLIWKSPDPRYSARRVEGTVRLIDIAPTILQQIGTRPPAVMQGTGLSRSLMGRRHVSLEAYSESYYPRLQFGWSELRSLQRYPFKYIESPDPELYNLAEDPGELKNLIETNRSMANSLREELMDQIQRYSAGTVPGNMGMDAETAAALASLGYVAMSAPVEMSDRSYLDLPDPKAKINIYNRTTDTYSMIREGKFSQAIQAFESILRDDPKATFVYHTMGTAYAKMGQHRRAVEAFLKASESFPEDSMLFFNLGNSYLRLRNWTKAEESFEKVLEVDPSHFRAKGNLASLWLQNQRFSDALKASKEILQKHPNYEVALYNAGIASAATGKTQEGLTYLKRATEVNPANPQTWQFLGQLYVEMGEKAKAEECFAEFERLRGNR